MKIGIFGGSFDPIHIGHINAMIETYLKLDLDKVLVMPTYLSPFKGVVNTSSQDRFKMLTQCLEDFDYIEVDSYEIFGQTTTYTYDTLTYLNEQFVNDDLYFIIGTDHYQSFDRWKNNELLHDLAHFVVVNRENTDIEIQHPFIQLDINTVEVSSTVIRERLKNQTEVRHLLDHKVYQYIKEHRLYET